MDPDLRGPRLYRKKSGYYYAIYYHRGTQDQKWVALGTKRERIAEAKMARLITDGHDPFSTKANITIGEAAEKYLESRKKKCTEETVRDLRSFCDLFVAHCGPDTLLRHLTQNVVEDYYFQDRLALATQHGYYRRAKALLNWCAKQGWLDRSYTFELEAPRIPNTRHAYLKKEEFQALNEHLEENTPWLAPVIRVAVGTGIRLRGMQQMRWADVSMQEGHIKVTGKGDHERYVPIFPMVRETLESLNSHTEHVFTTPRRDHIHYHKTSRKFKVAVRALDLSEDYNFHTLRHTFASWLVQEGTPLIRIQQWMGHSTIQVTEGYAHLAESTKPDKDVNPFPQV